MSIEKLKTQVRYAFEETSKGNYNPLDELFVPNVVDHSIEREPNAVPGLEGMKFRLQSLFAAFPDAELTIDNMRAENNQVEFYWKFSGTNTGSFRGMEPTGKSVNITGTNVEVFDDDRIVEHFSSMNRFGIMQQLGLLSSPGGDGN
jgi:predicted ester cyclase